MRAPDDGEALDDAGAKALLSVPPRRESAGREARVGEARQGGGVKLAL